ncbi:MAG: radical SAM protein [Firmicutes bacterium]|nr:radical SAM protein [Bacillota bacterium]
MRRRVINRRFISNENLASNWIAYGLREPKFSGTLPDLMQLETTSYCNLKCSFCPHDQMTRSNGFITLELIKVILAQSDHVALVGPNHMAEPLLHPKIGQIVAEFEDAGISTTILTNALLLTPEMRLTLISSGLSRDHIT